MVAADRFLMDRYAYIIGVFSDIVASRRADRNTFDMK
eukprot:COSAG04_NODE_4280_length_2188_cov_20.050263_1_plen_36_part_10